LLSGIVKFVVVVVVVVVAAVIVAELFKLDTALKAYIDIVQRSI